MREGVAAPSLAQQFAALARVFDEDGVALYAALCAGIVEDRELLDLVATAPLEQRRPNLLLAAVHFLLLGGAGGRLARWYPTLQELQAAGSGKTRVPSGRDPRELPAAARTDLGKAYRDFAAFCHDHREDLVELLATRATQTNEVGRCAALLPALAEIHRRCGQPLAVIDLGTSAGLNLLLDRYGYAYSDGRRSGDPTSSVRLDCQLRCGRPPLAVPPLAQRVGIDLNPVDPTDADQARWLLACQWPDQLERFRQLLQALEIARAAPRPTMVTGDMVGALGTAAAAIDPEARLCVLHSWAAAYLPPGRQRALAETVEVIGSERPVSWLFAELPYEVPGLPVPPAPARGRRGATALVHVALDGTEPLVERLGDMHPHGSWLQWWGPAG